MSARNFGQIRSVTPADDVKIKEFNYLQVGTSGTVAIKYQGGEVFNITGNLLDRVDILPIGLADEILATGTTATDVYVW